MVINIDTQKVLIQRLYLADNLWRRLLGLLPCRNLADGEGMLLTPCRGIHTMFMRFTIDVLYLDHLMRVVAVFPEVKPWRVLPIISEGRHVLEIPSGMLVATETVPGHRLYYSNELYLKERFCLK